MSAPPSCKTSKISSRTTSNTPPPAFSCNLTEPEAGDVVTENVPMRMSLTPGKVRGVAPLMGEHTHEIARNLLGLSDDEIKKIGRREGALLTIEN